MKLRKINKTAATEVEISPELTILYSYETPVAAHYNGRYYRVDKFYSVTTSKHINRWLNGVEAQKITPEVLQNIIANSE